MLRFLRNKAGYGLIETIISICVLSTITITSMTLLTNMMASLEFFRSNVVAQTLATSKVNLLSVTDYASVANEARAQIDTTYKLDRELVVNEADLGGGKKKKDITINVYKTGTSNTLFTMSYTLASSGTGGGGGNVPSGGVITWTGSVANIPSGWALCDGTNGTPDLRNRFIIGAGVDSGGGYTPTTTETGTGIFRVADHGGQGMHQLTIAEMPNHTHPIATGAGSSDGSSYYVIGAFPSYTGTPGEYYNTSYTGGSGAHNTMPPYYALCYIMKL